MKSLIVIPSRYASERLPGKPLLLINDRPMVRIVYENAARAKLADKVVVATDHARILDAVKGFGGDAVMTAPELPSGSDRVCAAARLYDGYDIIINLQGDEPMMHPDAIDTLISLMKEPEVSVGSLMIAATADELDNPNAVKVVTDLAGYALYFSRSCIPYLRNPVDAPNARYFKHLGIYGFKRETLEAFVAMPPADLEKVERLEQLRLLANGIRIKMAEVPYDSIGVDTAEDLKRVEALLIRNESKAIER